ncbi:M24 family metallopeptidase [Enterococcus timonensis]|uniref:M24 family metallopeptidase n=1 Tax=Enterococcus timonensis TaxID=1852364 RepID=UPI0008D9993B|nr:Xaa-Pro peptidase family protein [Enterococcus timonensis]
MNIRLKKLQEKIIAEDVSAILITSPYNLRYITGFTGTTGLAVVTSNKSFFVTDFRYQEQAADQIKDFQILQNRGPIFEEVEKIVQAEKIDDLGFEQEYLTFAAFDDLSNTISCDLTALSGVIESMREVKDEKEIDLIQQACAITDEAFSHILKFITPGMTEIQVANELDFFMRSKGASGVSFETIVASGVRSAMPHGVASTKKIASGELVTIDFGCYYQGYVSDMTRTFALGDPGSQLKEIYQIVLAANQAVIENAKAGINGLELDTIARKIIGDAGYGENFGHGLGHGIGLEIHEAPAVSASQVTPYVAGNIITDEPGIYLPKIGGVRIEDDLLILENGCHVFNHAPKELIIL